MFRIRRHGLHRVIVCQKEATFSFGKIAFKQYFLNESNFKLSNESSMLHKSGAAHIYGV